MPPADNSNKNSPNFSPLKVGLDPVFRGPTPRAQDLPPAPPAGVSAVLNNQQYVTNPPSAADQSSLQKNTGTILGNPTAHPRSIIRTYQGDMESAIAADHLSSINIAIAENQKMQEQVRAEQAAAPLPTASEYSVSKIIIFLSLLLLLAGGGILTYVFWTKAPGNTPTNQTMVWPTLFTTEYQAELNVGTTTTGQLTTALAGKLLDSQIPAGNFSTIYLSAGTSTRYLLSAPDFVTRLGFKLPDVLKRNLQSDFMIGTYAGERNEPFLILKATSFESSYAGMLNWEKNLEKDFRPLFRLPGYDQVSDLGTLLTPGAVTRPFEDKVILNKDVRLLRAENKNVILLYSLIDKETIIITVSDTAFKEILNRLNKENTLKR